MNSLTFTAPSGHTWTLWLTERRNALCIVEDRPEARAHHGALALDFFRRAPLEVGRFSQMIFGPMPTHAQTLFFLAAVNALTEGA